MLDSWNASIFSTIKNRLQDASMKLVQAERNGEAFDSQLVIGVRESYGEKGVLPSSFPSQCCRDLEVFQSVFLFHPRSELVFEHGRQAPDLPRKL
jgi:hypothetical protein